MHLVSVAPHIIFQALSDETRLRIVRLLAESCEEACLCDLTDSLLEPEYNLSKHLKILRQAGLLSATKEGRWVYHKITEGDKSLDLLLESIRRLRDSEKVFDLDLKRFKRIIQLRTQKRCTTSSNSSIKMKSKHR